MITNFFLRKKKSENLNFIVHSINRYIKMSLLVSRISSNKQWKHEMLSNKMACGCYFVVRPKTIFNENLHKYHDFKTLHHTHTTLK